MSKLVKKQPLVEHIGAGIIHLIDGEDPEDWAEEWLPAEEVLSVVVTEEHGAQVRTAAGDIIDLAQVTAADFVEAWRLACREQE